MLNIVDVCVSFLTFYKNTRWNQITGILGTFTLQAALAYAR